MAETGSLYVEKAEPAERVALLARLDERLGAYPRLRPSGAPVLAALVAAAGALLTVLLS